jgi:outer membrane protein assembly factor BamE (lipoprotein component of BamABCDE complex)
MPHRVTPSPLPLRIAGFPLLALLTLSACGGSGSAEDSGAVEPGTRQAATADPEWLWLQRSKQDLDRRREQLAALGPAPSPPSADAARLAHEAEALAAELDRRLVDYINAYPPVQGEPLTARQQAALRMKSDEDLAVAREYVEKGGDYQRAAEICEAALAVDPDNPRLKEELEQIRAARFMTAERFREVKKGMTPREVRALLGAPNPHNVRAYPERGIEAWFYAKDPAGAAAGVWFEKRPREEDTRVYQLDFDAIRPAPPPAPPADRTAPPGPNKVSSKPTG